MNVNNFTNVVTPGYSQYQKYGKNNLSLAKKVILLPPGTIIATQAAASMQSTWVGLAKNPMLSRIHPFPLAFDAKPTPGKSKFQKTALSGNQFVMEDVDELEMSFNIDPILASILYQYNNLSWDVVKVDSNRNILGTTPDGITFKGLKTTMVHLSPMAYADGSKMSENILTISFADPLEFALNPAQISGFDLNWNPLDLQGTDAVKMTVTNPVATGFTVSVNTFGMDLNSPGSGYAGLVKADFVLKKSGSNVSLTAATMVDNGDGSYTFAGLTGLTGAYTIGLVPTASISVLAYNIDVPVLGTFTV